MGEANNRTSWSRWDSMTPRTFQCGYCGETCASDLGLAGSRNNKFAAVYFCVACDGPNYFQRDFQVPGPLVGEDVENLPTTVQALYDEARASLGVAAPTGAAMLCRALLSHVALELGAVRGTFEAHVEFLIEQSGYLPAKSKDWLNHIRNNGNVVNHQLVTTTTADAMELLEFATMLLKLVYEFPNRLKPKATSKPEST